MPFDTTRKSLFQLDIESFSSAQGATWNTSSNISNMINHWKDLLTNDANSLYINTLLSLSEALFGIKKKTLSWSTVKLYYALFYILKVELYLDSIGIFRDINNKGALFEIDLRVVNCEFIKKTGKNAGSDHYTILNVHEAKYGNFDAIYAQLIDGENIPVWMRTQREIANYKQIKFEDPSRNDLFIDFNFDKLGRFEFSNTNIYLDTAAMAAIPITKCIQVRNKFDVLSLTNDTYSLILDLFENANVPEQIQKDLIGEISIL